MGSKIIKVIVFAIAFAFVEAAVVVYLRHLLGAVQPQVAREEVLLLIPGIAFLEPQTALKMLSWSGKRPHLLCLPPWPRLLQRH